VKVRSRAVEVPCTISEDQVHFDEPQKAVTPGQAAVFFDGDVVLGGGTIGRVLARELADVA
jgi:tRNA-specific 2-thiouridylase